MENQEKYLISVTHKIVNWFEYVTMKHATGFIAIQPERLVCEIIMQSVDFFKIKQPASVVLILAVEL